MHNKQILLENRYNANNFFHTTTVKELKAALADLPDDFIVITEGCDCFGGVASVYIDFKAKEVTLERATKQ